MIRVLVLRDPYLRLVIPFALAAALNSIFLASVSISTTFPFLTMLGAITLATIVMRPESMSRRFDEMWLTLPVSAEQVSRARLCAMLIASLLPPLLGALILVAAAPADQRESAVTVSLGVIGSAGLSAVVHNVLSRGANFIGMYQWLPTFLILGLGLVGTIYVATPWFGGGLVAATAVLGVLSWRDAPDWIECVPTRVGENNPVAKTSRSRSARTATDTAVVGAVASRAASCRVSDVTTRFPEGEPVAGLSRSSLARAATAQWTVRDPAWVASLILCGVMTAMVFCTTRSVVIFLPWVAFGIHALNVRSSQVLRTIGHLPVDRRRIATVVVLPGLLVGLLGIVACDLSVGSYFRSMFHNRVRLDAMATVIDGEKEYSTTTSIPESMWRLHLGFDEPSFESPRGERHDLVARRPVPFVPIAIYNPYHIPADASIEFASWQVRELIAKAFGERVSELTVAERYLKVGYNGRIHRRFGSESEETFYDRFEDAELVDQPTTLGTRLGLFLLVWFSIGLFSFRPRQFPRPQPGWRHLPKSLWIGLGVFLGFYALTLSRDTTRLLNALARAPTEFGSSWIAVVVLVGIAVLFATGLMARFARMDLPPAPPAAPIDRLRGTKY